MYVLVDPWVSVAMQIVNLFVMHDRESFDRDLGLEILETRQKNHWIHFLKLFNHLKSLENTHNLIEREEKRYQKENGLEVRAKLFLDPLEHPHKRLDKKMKQIKEGEKLKMNAILDSE